jgi:hypothetical protein
MDEETPGVQGKNRPPALEKFLHNLRRPPENPNGSPAVAPSQK